MSSNDDEFVFEGFEPSNTTPVPDVFFDVLLDQLSDAELRVMLYVIRRTLGFKKSTDSISLTQFQKGIITKEGKILDKGCGLKNRTAIHKALASLEQKGCLISVKEKLSKGNNMTTKYRIHFRGEGSASGVPPAVRQADHSSASGVPPAVRQADPQETVIQETDKQQTVNKGEKGAKAPKSLGSLSKNINKEVLISPETTALMDLWDSICKYLVPRDKKHIESAKELARCGATKDDLLEMQKFCLRINPEWYEKSGVDLAAIARNWGKWKSLLPKQADKSVSTANNAALSFDDASQLADDAVAQAQDRGYQMESRIVNHGNNWAVAVTWLSGRQAKRTITSRAQWNEEFIGLSEMADMLRELQGAK